MTYFFIDALHVPLVGDQEVLLVITILAGTNVLEYLLIEIVVYSFPT